MFTLLHSSYVMMMREYNYIFNRLSRKYKYGLRQTGNGSILDHRHDKVRSYSGHRCKKRFYVFGRPPSEAYLSANSIAKSASVRVSVIRVDCGETRKPTEFTFGRYLPWRTSTPTQRATPSFPQSGSYGPEILGSMGRYRPTVSNRDQIWHEHTP